MARAADPAAARDAARRIVATLRAAGHVAYFAGGCVRDELLGLRPTDYDVATDAPPPRIRELFKGTHAVGEAFGVVLVPIDHAIVEVATFRSDGVYSDKRRPDAVTFCDAQHDAQRRDFTINALFLDPVPLAARLPVSSADAVSPQGGQVIDFVNGLADLKAKLLRAVGDPDKRLAEDHLRALRAARFAARLGFDIDPATADAVRRHAAQLSGVSRERVGQEVARMMAHPARAVAAGLMQDLHLDAPALGEPHHQVPTPILASINGDAPPFALCLAAWALDRHTTPAVPALDPAKARKLVTAWRKSLCLSNADRDALADALRVHHAVITAWPALPLAGQKRLAAEPCFPHALTLLEPRDPARAETVLARVKELHAHGPGVNPQPLVTGDDLVLLGLKPGPSFARILDFVYDAQLEARFFTKDAALAYARELAGRSGV